MQNGTCDSFAHLPAMRGRRFARCFCRYFLLNNREKAECDNEKSIVKLERTYDKVKVLGYTLNELRSILVA